MGHSINLAQRAGASGQTGLVGPGHARGTIWPAFPSLLEKVVVSLRYQLFEGSFNVQLTVDTHRPLICRPSNNAKPERF